MIDHGGTVVFSGDVVIDNGCVMIGSGCVMVDSGGVVVDSGDVVIESGGVIIDSGFVMVESADRSSDSYAHALRRPVLDQDELMTAGIRTYQERNKSKESNTLEIFIVAQDV